MLPDLPENMDEEARNNYVASFDTPPVNRTITIDDGLYHYLVNYSVRESTLLRELRAETSLYHMARMQISPETAQFLGLLLKIQNAKKILEIGVFTGYSTLSMALAMAPDAQLLSIEKKQMWLDIANRYIAKAGLESRVKTQCGLAIDVLKSLLRTQESEQVFNSINNGYDFIFIDADKNSQLEYYQLAKKLLNTGGCIAIDNTLWWGNVAKTEFTDKDTQLVRQLNQYIYADQEVDISMIPIGDGLTLIRKR